MSSKEGRALTREVVEQVSGALVSIQGHLTPCATNLVGVAAGDTVDVLWKGGKPLLIVNAQVRRSGAPPMLPEAAGVVEELFIAPSQRGGSDVWFRNDQQVTQLRLETFVTGDKFAVGWGLRPDTFFLAVGDLESPGMNFKVFIFQLNRFSVLNKPYGARRPLATLKATWLASSLSLDLSTINFNAFVCGVWHDASQTTGGPNGVRGFGRLRIAWTDTLIIKFEELLANDQVRFRSFVLDEKLELHLLLEANIEARRTGPGDVYPRHDGSKIVDTSEMNDGGAVFGFFPLVDPFVQKTVLKEIDLVDLDNPATKNTWKIDPANHLYLVNVSASTPVIEWRTMREPFTFRWRKVFSGSFPNPVQTSPDFSGRGPSPGDFAVLVGFGYPGAGLMGDQVSGSTDGQFTTRWPIDEAQVPIITPQTEIEVVVGGVSIDTGIQQYQLGVPSGSILTQRSWRKLKRTNKWDVTNSVPRYIGRRAEEKKLISLMQPRQGLVALAADQHDVSHNFVYVTSGGLPFNTNDSVTGSEIPGAQKTIHVAAIDLTRGPGAFVLITPTVVSETLTFVIDFQSGNEFHLLWRALAEGAAGAIHLNQYKTGLRVLVGTDLIEFSVRKIVVLRPDQLYIGQRNLERFVKGWDATTGAPTLKQPSYLLDPRLRESGKLLALGPVPLIDSLGREVSSFQAIDDPVVGKLAPQE